MGDMPSHRLGRLVLAWEGGMCADIILCLGLLASWVKFKITESVHKVHHWAGQAYLQLARRDALSPTGEWA